MQNSGDPNFDLILSDHSMVVPSPSPCPIGVVSVSATTAKGPFNLGPGLASREQNSDPTPSPSFVEGANGRLSACQLGKTRLSEEC